MFDALKRSIAGRILGTIDKAGLKRWPVAWIKVRRAAAGWKLVVGYLVYETPDILLWANDVLPGLLSAAGVEDAKPIVQGIGSVLMAVGAIHKFQKFLAPIDRRTDERTAAVVEKAAVAKEVKKDTEHLPEGMYTKTELNREVDRRLKERDKPGPRG